VVVRRRELPDKLYLKGAIVGTAVPASSIERWILEGALAGLEGERRGLERKALRLKAEQARLRAEEGRLVSKITALRRLLDSKEEPLALLTDQPDRISDSPDAPNPPHITAAGRKRISAAHIQRWITLKRSRERPLKSAASDEEKK
jgi:hypothetical protein